jgi:hypothetical protein
MLLFKVLREFILQVIIKEKAIYEPNKNEHICMAIEIEQNDYQFQQ